MDTLTPALIKKYMSINSPGSFSNRVADIWCTTFDGFSVGGNQAKPRWAELCSHNGLCCAQRPPWHEECGSEPAFINRRAKTSIWGSKGLCHRKTFVVSTSQEKRDISKKKKNISGWKYPFWWLPKIPHLKKILIPQESRWGCSWYFTHSLLFEMKNRDKREWRVVVV